MVQLQADAEALEQLGFQIVAVSIDPPDKLAETAERWGVSFRLLSDPEIQLAHAYGVGYRSEGKPGLPVPAVFLIDAQRTIRFQYVNPKYQVRLGQQVLLAAARELAPGAAAE